MNLFTRLMLALMGLVFMGLVALWLLVYGVFATLRWMVTGRKPQVVMMWQGLRAFRERGFQAQGFPGAQASPTEHAGHVDVEDAVVREVHEVREARAVNEDRPRLTKD
jgi:hypothetical protein